MTAPGYRYFYVYYQAEIPSGSLQGNTILRQLEDPARAGDGLNIASAHTWLLANFGNGMIISWHETTEYRYKQWLEFCEALEIGTRMAKGQKPKLDVVQGGKDHVDASAGPTDKPAGIRIVEPEKKEPDPAS